MGERITEHSAQPVTATEGFNHLRRVISKRAPAYLWHAGRSRRGLRRLRGGR